MRNSDGREGQYHKQDCELNAGYRMLARLRADYPRMAAVIVADSLYSKQPLVERLRAGRLSSLLVAKPGDHKCLYQEVDLLRQANLPNRHVSVDSRGIRHQYEWVTEVSLTGKADSGSGAKNVEAGRRLVVRYRATGPGVGSRVWIHVDGGHGMTRRRSGKQGDVGATPNGGATIGHEAELWAMADALRGLMDAAEYKHVVLGLIFLKYISDAFEERHAAVLAELGEDAAEDRDEYIAENIFWVPAEARWSHLRARARQPTVGLTVDQAMAAIERDNPALEDVLPRDYARPALDKRRLGQLTAPRLTKTFRASARAPRSTRCAGTVTC